MTASARITRMITNSQPKKTHLRSTGATPIAARRADVSQRGNSVNNRLPALARELRPEKSNVLLGERCELLDSLVIARSPAT